MNIEVILPRLCEIYGEPTGYRDRNKTIMSLFNAQLFAALFKEIHQPVYIPREKQFYRYDHNTGLYFPVTDDEMLDKLSLFLHNYAVERKEPAVETKRTVQVLRSIITFLRTLAADKDFFKPGETPVLHCTNGILELYANGTHVLKPFSPEYHCRHSCGLAYSSGTQFRRFLKEFLIPLVGEEHVDLVQRYLGQCLFGCNRTQTMLLLTGTGGSGKGTLANLAERLVGPENYSQIRPGHITGRFELNFFLGKTLLSGKESQTSFFTANGMDALKSLVGGDDLRAERKNSNRHDMLHGNLNVIIVGNSIPRFEFESEAEKSAWERRMIWVPCKSFTPQRREENFHEVLIREEGSAILNWILEGTRKVLADGIPMTAERAAGLNYLFGAADPIPLFLTSMLMPQKGKTITVDELFNAFGTFCDYYRIPMLTERDFQKKISGAMRKQFGIAERRDVKRSNIGAGKETNRAGFYHIRFIKEV